MRALLWFLAAIFGTLFVAALVAWPVWGVVHPLQPDWPYHRVIGRLWQAMLLIGLVLACRRLDLHGRDDWGYGIPRSLFLRESGTGFAIGVATMLPMTLAMLALGILVPRTGLGLLKLADILVNAFLAGAAVGLLEETFFRGLMYRAIERESGFAVAAWSTAIAYSAVHFLARTSIPAEEVVSDSGIRLLAGALANFADPFPVLGSFVTLLLVGLLLAGVRRRTGAIAMAVGLHAGWVFVIKSTTAATRFHAEAPASSLVELHDGYTGWLVAGWGAILVAIAWTRGWLGPRAPAAR